MVKLKLIKIVAAILLVASLFVNQATTASGDDNSINVDKYICKINELKQKGEVKNALTMAEEIRRFVPQSFSLLLLTADLHRDLGDYSAAINLYNDVCRMKPDYLYYWTSLAYCLEQNGELEKAYNYYLKAMLMEPENPDGVKYYLALAGKLKKETQIFNDIYRKLAKPNSIAAQEILTYLVNGKKFNLVIDYCKYWQTKQKLDPLILLKMADCYAGLNDAKKGYEILKNSIDVNDPDLETTIKNTANFIMQNGLGKYALQELELTHEQPVKDKLLFILVLLHDKNTHDQVFDKITDIMFEQYTINRRISEIAAKLLWGFENSKIVERLYGKTLGNLPENAIYILAVSLLEEGRLIESSELYEQLVQINPQNIKYQYNLGVIYERMNKTDKAYEKYKNALSLSKEDIEWIERKWMTFIKAHQLQQRFLTDYVENKKERYLYPYQEQAYARRFLSIGLYEKSMEIINYLLNDNAVDIKLREDTADLLTKNKENPIVYKYISNIKLDSIPPELKWKIAELIRETCGYEKVEEFYQTAIQDDPSNPWLKISLVECYENQGMLKKAVEQLLEIHTDLSNVNDWIKLFKNRNSKLLISQ